MSFNELKHDETLRKLGIVGISFFAQVLCVQRAFPVPAYSLVLCGLIAMFLVRSWLTHRSQKVSLDNQAGKTDGTWAIVAVLVVAAFLVAKFALHRKTDNSLVDFAHATVFSALIGQIAIVATDRFRRPELLVLATITTVTSMVCVGESLTLYRQIAEAAVAICLFALMSSMATPSTILVNTSSTRQRLTISIIVLAMVVVAGRPLATALDTWMPTLQLQLSGAIEESLIEDHRAPSFVGRYVDTASLNDVVKQFDNDPQAIALRVYSEHMAGYLRGRAFETYGQGRWIRHRHDRRVAIDEQTRLAMLPRTIDPDPATLRLVSGLSTPRHDPVDSSQLNSFALSRDPSGKTITLEIENDARRGEFFFLPLHATSVLGVGRRLTLDPNGIAQAGLDTRHTYSAIVHKFDSPSPISSPLRETLLRVPSGIAQPLTQIAEELCGDSTSTLAKARRLSDYFQKNFRYSTERIETARNVDPIQNFLESRHAAHCEYFASATTLLLRTAGIPARYVTGYVVNQKSEEQDYWLARNMNAHAWVEAYDDASNRWFIVESTPGRSVPEFLFASDQSIAESGQGGNKEKVQDFWFDLDWRVWQLLKAGQWSLAMVEFSELMRWPFALVTIVLMVVMIRKHQTVSQHRHDLYSAEYGRLLRKADRSMKRFGLSRATVETIHCFAERIESATEPSAENRDRANWYREFAELRYKSLAPMGLRSFPR